MAIVTASKKGTVVVIDPDESRAEEAREMLTGSMKNIAVINTKCLSLRPKEIDELVSDGNYRKVFYGCSADFFNKMVEGLNSKNGEVIHIGWKLDISKIVIYYWKGIFQPTVSRQEESFGQEL